MGVASGWNLWVWFYNIYVYQYFQKETAKNQYRRGLKLMSRNAEVTGYREHTLRGIVAKKKLTMRKLLTRVVWPTKLE